MEFSVIKTAKPIFLITGRKRKKNFPLDPNVTPEAIKLLWFPFFVTGEALNSLPINSIVTWEELVKQFLNNFYPPNKTARHIDKILQYKQQPTETLQETWEKFKGMLVKCPHHGIPDQMLGQRFYMGLADNLKANVDASAGGAFLSKTFTDCKVLLDKMSQNSGWMTRGTTLAPIVHLVPLDPNNLHGKNMATLMTQMSILTKKIDEMGTKQLQDNNMMEIRGMLQQLIGTNNKVQEKLAVHDSAIKNIETQLGQLSTALNNRPQGTFPADTKINPKEQNLNQLMAVSLWNGRDLDREQEIIQASKESTPVTPVPLEVEEPTELTEMVVEQSHEEKGKDKMNEQAAE
uniref:Uncharacterized protein LOC104236725 n=1 Tax=Nicotiana sylvestris TaxID=4096 RepID=A0A1U7XQ07_NICSY|nr:PREDICTED: uncharacterized protein LOC104236725 [Nicotiana sylvestris]